MKRALLALAALFAIGNAPVDEAMALLEAGKEAEALALVERAAGEGDMLASAYLAWLYENGWHVEQDTAKAEELYRGAADLGQPFAQWRLGVMIDQGTAQGSLEQAVELFRAAAAQGDSQAMTSLAVMYAAGRGVEQDHAETLRYYEMAARKGNPHALQGIGVLYFNGEGVGQDLVEGMAHWLVALSLGNEAASAHYQRESRRMTDPQMHAVTARANAIAQEYGLESRFSPWSNAPPAE